MVFFTWYMHTMRTDTADWNWCNKFWHVLTMFMYSYSPSEPLESTSRQDQKANVSQPYQPRPVVTSKLEKFMSARVALGSATWPPQSVQVRDPNIPDSHKQPNLCTQRGCNKARQGAKQLKISKWSCQARNCHPAHCNWQKRRPEEQVQVAMDLVARDPPMRHKRRCTHTQQQLKVPGLELCPADPKETSFRAQTKDYGD